MAEFSVFNSVESFSVLGFAPDGDRVMQALAGRRPVAVEQLAGELGWTVARANTVICNLCERGAATREGEKVRSNGPGCSRCTVCRRYQAVEAVEVEAVGA